MVGRKSRSRTPGIRRGTRGGFFASERGTRCRRAGATHTCTRRKAPASRPDSLSPLLSPSPRSGRGARNLAYESRWRAFDLDGHHDAFGRADVPPEVLRHHLQPVPAARRSTCTLGSRQRWSAALSLTHPPLEERVASATWASSWRQHFLLAQVSRTCEISIMRRQTSHTVTSVRSEATSDTLSV